MQNAVKKINIFSTVLRTTDYKTNYYTKRMHYK